MKITDEVAVFWDYENCPAPTSASGYATVNSIRSVAQTFGSVKLFKAYLEVTEQVLVSRAAVLRSELQSSGVSLTDCPHNGRKDVADKMILVDMLAHAIDNPAPSTIVLISGDRDFAYALSILRLRHYRIVLITLSNAHQSLKAQASLCFDWIDILEPVDLTSGLSHQPTSPRRGKTSLPPTHDKFYSDLKGHNPSRHPVQESYDEKSSASNIEFKNYSQDATRRREPSRTPPEHDARHDFLPPDLGQIKRQPAVVPVVSDTLRNEPELSSRPIHYSVASSGQTNLNCSIDTPLTVTACGLNPSKTTLTSTTSAESIMTSGSSAPSALQDSAKPLNTAQHEVTSDIKPMSIDCAIRMLRAEASLRESSPSSQPQGAYPPVNAKPQNLSSVDHMVDDDPDPPLAYLGSSPPACITATASTPSIMMPSSLSHATVPVVAQAASSRQHSSFPVPEKFKILIRCLKTHRSRGILYPLRSKIASEIAQNGTTYRLAGASEFGDYVAMAEKASIVQLGGSETTAWIALKAPWYNARLS